MRGQPRPNTFQLPITFDLTWWGSLSNDPWLSLHEDLLHHFCHRCGHHLLATPWAWVNPWSSQQLLTKSHFPTLCLSFYFYNMDCHRLKVLTRTFLIHACSGRSVTNQPYCTYLSGPYYKWWEAGRGPGNGANLIQCSFIKQMLLETAVCNYWNQPLCLEAAALGIVIVCALLLMYGWNMQVSSFAIVLWSQISVCA